MENLRKINKIDGWKRVLLKFSGYSSILAARKEYINYTDKQIYEEFKENYNKTIEDIQLDERRRKQKEKQRQKQRERREQSIFPFSNDTIEYLGQKLKKQISDNKRPFKIVIKNKIASFNVSQPFNITEDEHIINENEFGKHFIIWAKDEREAKKKAEEDFNNQIYNQIWDGLGNIYIEQLTIHNLTG